MERTGWLKVSGKKALVAKREAKEAYITGRGVLAQNSEKKNQTMCPFS